MKVKRWIRKWLRRKVTKRRRVARSDIWFFLASAVVKGRGRGEALPYIPFYCEYFIAIIFMLFCCFLFDEGTVNLERGDGCGSAGALFHFSLFFFYFFFYYYVIFGVRFRNLPRRANRRVEGKIRQLYRSTRRTNMVIDIILYRVSRAKIRANISKDLS